eukprot:g8343.t1
MWGALSPKKKEPEEVAHADYHFEYKGKELHCRSEYLFTGDWETVTKLALKARDERPIQPGFRVKKLANSKDGTVEYEWGWSVPTLLQFILRTTEFIWSEVVTFDEKNQKLVIIMENKNLRNWGTFFEESTYSVEKKHGKNATVFVKKACCTKPFFVPWKLVEAYAIKYLNYAYESREDENAIVTQYLLDQKKQKKGNIEDNNSNSKSGAKGTTMRKNAATDAKSDALLIQKKLASNNDNEFIIDTVSTISP